MTPVTYTNLNKLLLIRDIQDIAKTYINDDRSCCWIWKNKIADVYHIGYVTFMNKAILIIPDPTASSASSRIFFVYSNFLNTRI